MFLRGSAPTRGIRSPSPGPSAGVAGSPASPGSPSRLGPRVSDPHAFVHPLLPTANPQIRPAPSKGLLGTPRPPHPEAISPCIAFPNPRLTLTSVGG